jgi:hypothetical protein
VPCSLVDRCDYLREIWCFHLQAKGLKMSSSGLRT